MKLYKLSVTVDLVVYAEDAIDAKHIANIHLVEEARNIGFSDWTDAVEITSATDLPKYWDVQCIPFLRPPDPPDEPKIKTILTVMYNAKL